MLSGEARIRPLLSAALKEISIQDFPERWPALLPGLVQKLQTPDLTQQNGVLKVINTLFNKSVSFDVFSINFRRYRQADHSDPVLLQLQYILQHFANPLIQIFKASVPNFKICF